MTESIYSVRGREIFLLCPQHQRERRPVMMRSDAARRALLSQELLPTFVLAQPSIKPHKHKIWTVTFLNFTYEKTKQKQINVVCNQWIHVFSKLKSDASNLHSIQILPINPPIKELTKKNVLMKSTYKMLQVFHGEQH